jgi:hypothetical protein
MNWYRPAMRGGLPFVIVVALSLAAMSCSENATRTVTSLRIKSCTIQTRKAACGRLLVPEDRISGRGRRIDQPRKWRKPTAAPWPDEDLPGGLPAEQVLENLAAETGHQEVPAASPGSPCPTATAAIRLAST